MNMDWKDLNIGWEYWAATIGPQYFRLDGSPYPMTEEGWIEWLRDFSDTRFRIVRQDQLWNGVLVSTIWLGLNHRFGDGPPIIFETMAFDQLNDFHEVDGRRYSTLAEAEEGHAAIRRDVSGFVSTLRRWWRHAFQGDDDY